MKTTTYLLLFCMVTASGTAISDSENAAVSNYGWMKQLGGAWTLAPAAYQQGKATQHKLVAPLVGTDTTTMEFKVIGMGSTVQENLLPGTKKEMATMYHCSDVSCSKLAAKHYCVKQNQPELLANLANDHNTLTFDCDMSTELCQSKQNHIHRISHALSNNGNHLTTTYTTFNDGEYMKDSVYHFVRK